MSLPYLTCAMIINLCDNHEVVFLFAYVKMRLFFTILTWRKAALHPGEKRRRRWSWRHICGRGVLVTSGKNTTNAYASSTAEWQVRANSSRFLCCTCVELNPRFDRRQHTTRSVRSTFYQDGCRLLQLIFHHVSLNRLVTFTLPS